MNKLMFSQKSSFPPLLRLTYLLQHKSEEALMGKVGISLSHAHMMSGLSGSVPVSQHQLAVMLVQTESNVSRQLNLMKKQGLVSIAKNKQDSRVRDVKLTAKGASKYKVAQAVLKKQLGHLQKLDSAKDRKVSEKVVSNLLSALSHDVATKRSLIR